MFKLRIACALPVRVTSQNQNLVGARDRMHPCREGVKKRGPGLFDRPSGNKRAGEQGGDNAAE